MGGWDESGVMGTGCNVCPLCCRSQSFGLGTANVAA